MKHLSLLLGIILLSAVLRFFQLSSLPNGLYWDEDDTGYQSFSLLTTGKDYFGNPFPLFPHSLSDFRTPANLYLLVPVIKLFGLSAFSVRFPSALFGTLSVFLIYYLARLLFKNKNIALISSLSLSLSIWHVLFSRTALDGITAMLFFFLLGLVLYLKNSNKLSAFFLSLSLYSYSPAKLFVPLFVLCLILVYKLEIKRLLIFLAILGVLSAPLYLDSIFGASSTRFHDISIFTEPTLSDQVNLSRLQHQIASGITQSVGMSPGIYDKLISNKFILVAGTLVTNYLKSYSPQFLFISGDPQLRHSPSLDFVGQFQVFDFFPAVLGIAMLFSPFSATRPGKLLIAWLLLSPLPAALTRDGGMHAGRTFFLLPVISMLIALGISRLKKPILVSYVSLSFISYILVFDYFFTFYRVESAKAFNYGFSQVASTSFAGNVIVDAHKENALMSYLFYSRFSPAQFSQMLPFKYQEFVPGLSAVKINNFYFLPPGDRHWNDFLPQLDKNSLVITAATQPLADKLPIQKTISYPDGSPAFYFVPIFK